jgi:7,8-dihydropterin-6-yl-methyl-4-(beta-D-ribofuranosyl)aminobenzene 5'-phosphate synthase
MEKTTITILVENSACLPGLKSEHGLSLWIETSGLKILMDTGQSDIILENARTMGITLEEADYIVLSHGHYDHTGGLNSVLQLNHKAPVILHPDALLTRYSLHPGKQVKSIGMPESVKEILLNLPSERLIWSSSPVALSPDIQITGPVQRKTEYEDVGGPFFMDKEGHLPDLLQDDQALWIKTSKEMIVCSGCAHSGIINILNQSREQSGCNYPLLVIGGFHLVNASNKRIFSTIEALKKMPISCLSPCHCTGLSAIRLIESELGDCVRIAQGGSVYQTCND